MVRVIGESQREKRKRTVQNIVVVNDGEAYQSVPGHVARKSRQAGATPLSLTQRSHILSIANKVEKPPAVTFMHATRLNVLI
jgi:hypothetical protein